MSLATHRLRLVTGPPIILHCIACGRKLSNTPQGALRAPRAYADLDGKPFVDYYCHACARAQGASLEDAHATN